MNAINFIKQHGVEKAREVVEGAPDGATHLSDDACHYVNADFRPLPAHIKEQLPKLIVIDDIERLVDSLDLVKSYGGIINAKHDVKYLDLDWDYDTPRITRLKQAIADYEQLFGNTETLELETLRDCDTSPNCKKFDERVNSNETK